MEIAFFPFIFSASEKWTLLQSACCLSFSCWNTVRSGLLFHERSHVAWASSDGGCGIVRGYGCLPICSFWCLSFRSCHSLGSALLPILIATGNDNILSFTSRSTGSFLSCLPLASSHAIPKENTGWRLWWAWGEEEGRVGIGSVGGREYWGTLPLLFSEIIY